MSKKPSIQYLQRILAQWPKDNIRPQFQFQDVVSEYYTGAGSATRALTDTRVTRQAVALRKLIDGDFQKQYPLTGSLLKPESNPHHFENLLRDLEETPSRGWLDRFKLRLAGMIRF